MGLSTALRRVFSDDKSIDSRLLNVLGVHVFRTIVARALFNLRPSSADESVKGKLKELRREGVVAWPDFLPEKHFEQVREEYSKVLANHRDEFVVHREGTNTFETANSSDLPQGELTGIRGALADPRLEKLLQGAERRPLVYQGGIDGDMGLDLLIQGEPSDIADSQTVLHTDVFFVSHKAWLYVTDVDPEDGPFAYVKRSHRVTPRQLYYSYKESIGGNQGSRRITPEELQRLGLEETMVTCRKNTLVVANTAGFHRRVRGA